MIILPEACEVCEEDMEYLPVNSKTALLVCLDCAREREIPLTKANKEKLMEQLIQLDWMDEPTKAGKFIRSANIDPDFLPRCIKAAGLLKQLSKGVGLETEDYIFLYELGLIEANKHKVEL